MGQRSGNRGDRKIFAGFARARDLSPQLGDLYELTQEMRNSGKGARLWFICQMLRILIYAFFRRIVWSVEMLINYLKVALRQWLRNRFHSAINVVGLSIGLACSILILFFVQDELRFDRFHGHSDRIYRLQGLYTYPTYWAIRESPGPLADLLRETYPEVELTVRIRKADVTCRKENELQNITILGTESSFFDLFSFPLLEGAGPLEGPGSVYLVEDLAERFFGSNSAQGQVLTLMFDDRSMDFRVAGIFKKLPAQSSIQFQAVVPLSVLAGETISSWQQSDQALFVRLRKANQKHIVEERLVSTLDQHLPKKEGLTVRYTLEPLARHHLHGKDPGDILQPSTDVAYAYILSSIAFLVLLIACINFLNLSLGRSGTRLKEIGTRKVLGAERKNLIRQFGIETLCSVLFAMILALILVGILLPHFNSFAGKNIRFSDLWRWQNLLGMAAVVVFTSLSAGLVPALMLSGISVVRILGGQYRFTGKNFGSRVLIVLQFVISTFLILCSLFLSLQLRFLLNQDLGYETETVLAVDLSQIRMIDGFSSKVRSLKQECLSIPGVLAASASSSEMGHFWARVGKSNDGGHTILFFNQTDSDFPGTLGLKIQTGRDFRGGGEDEGRVLVNEMFVRHFGIQDPVGRRLDEYFQIEGNHEIVGVLEDYYHLSLHQPLYPTYLECRGDARYSSLYCRLAGGRIRETIPLIQKLFESNFPDSPFIFQFLEDQIQLQYSAEKKWDRLMSISTFLAIFISISGLFGLTLLSVTRRSKEILIRRVLGASSMQVQTIIQREFAMLVLLGILLAFPAAYAAMHTYLQRFAYRISLSAFVFVLGGLLSMLLAAVTISAQVWRIAASNPADNLRHE